jgi:hypothetical protein
MTTHVHIPTDYAISELLTQLKQFNIHPENLELLVQSLQQAARNHRERILLDALILAQEKQDQERPEFLIQQYADGYDVYWPDTEHRERGFTSWDDAFVHGATEGGQLGEA